MSASGIGELKVVYWFLVISPRNDRSGHTKNRWEVSKPMVNPWDLSRRLVTPDGT